MPRFFDHNGVLMYEPSPSAGNCVTRKATEADMVADKPAWSSYMKPLLPVDEVDDAPVEKATKKKAA